MATNDNDVASGTSTKANDDTGKADTAEKSGDCASKSETISKASEDSAKPETTVKANDDSIKPETTAKANDAKIKPETIAKATSSSAKSKAAKQANDVNAKLIVVFGVTGRQGSSVAHSLLSDSQYKVRGVTRKPHLMKAKKLEKTGISLVKADLLDKESLRDALRGAHGCFLVTDFWETAKGDDEFAQGRHAIDVAIEMDVKHLVFSSLENVKEQIGKDCGHFDSKARIADYVVEKKLPHTFVQVPFYYENFMTVLRPEKQPDGRFALALPLADKAMYGVCVDEIGDCIRTIFANPQEYMSKTVGLAGDKLTSQQYADALTKHIKPLVFYPEHCPVSIYSEAAFPGADDMAVMFEYLQADRQQRDLLLTKKLNPDVSTFDQWVARNKDKILRNFRRKRENSDT